MDLLVPEGHHTGDVCDPTQKQELLRDQSAHYRTVAIKQQFSSADIGMSAEIFLETLASARPFLTTFKQIGSFFSFIAAALI
jgi:hypothetical protein